MLRYQEILKARWKLMRVPVVYLGCLSTASYLYKSIEATYRPADLLFVYAGCNVR